MYQADSVKVFNALTERVVGQKIAGTFDTAESAHVGLILRLVSTAVTVTQEVLAVDEVLPPGGGGPQAVRVADTHTVALLSSVGRPHCDREVRVETPESEKSDNWWRRGETDLCPVGIQLCSTMQARL